MMHLQGGIVPGSDAAYGTVLCDRQGTEKDREELDRKLRADAPTTKEVCVVFRGAYLNSRKRKPYELPMTGPFSTSTSREVARKWATDMPPSCDGSSIRPCVLRIEVPAGARAFFAGQCVEMVKASEHKFALLMQKEVILPSGSLVDVRREEKGQGDPPVWRCAYLPATQG